MFSNFFVQLIFCLDVIKTVSYVFYLWLIRGFIYYELIGFLDSVCDALTSSSSSFLSPDKIQSSTSATDIQSLTQVDQSYRWDI